MKIYQVAFSISPGDGISNCIRAIDRVLKEKGYETQILTSFFDPRVENLREDYSLSLIKEDDVVLYHIASYSKIADDFAKMKCKRAIMYHNITPPEFLKGYSALDAFRTSRGLSQLRPLSKNCDLAIAVSEFNRQDLLSYGFNPDTTVTCPYITDLASHDLPPDEGILNQYKGKKGANIMFAGRVVSHKRFEDVIKTFYYYKNFVDKDARLFLCGGLSSPKYYAQLAGLIHELQLPDVIFTNHIKFQELLAYYRLADVFVCMSEHEGFCVPLLEAMYFDVPIVAYSAAAIPETLGGAGILLKEKDFIAASEAIRKLQEDGEFRQGIIDAQRKRLNELSMDKTIDAFLKVFIPFIQGEKRA